jgi:ABC-2 type transport system ATP-binding protein
MNSATIVNLQGIKKTYPKDIVALKLINLTILEQEIIGIVGANGSGKSTLLKMLAGNLKPEQGTAKVFPLDAHKKTEHIKTKISYISQDRALDPEMTGKELLNYFSALYGLSGQSAKQRINEVIGTFELTDFIERRVNTYSGGQAQRLHLAIGIIHQPKLLLLDEPTSALDPKGKAFFWDFIRSYQEQGNTIIVVSHELNHVRQHCSRVLLIDKGSLIANDAPDTIVQTYATPVLHIKTTANLNDKDILKRLLQRSISSATIQFNGPSARLEINQGTELNKAKTLALVLQAFEERQQAVIECRWEQPGLENAYFKLTGESIVPTSSLKNNKKGQRKRQ